MKLIDLITFFRNGGTFEDFCKKHALNVESEVIEIYAEEPVSLESHLGFFPIEETEGQVRFQSQGVKYHSLFDFFYFLDAMESVKGISEPNDEQLARKLFTFAIKDA
jgi:hypothetical protein